MNITLLTSTRSIPTKYQSTRQAVLQAGLPLSRGRPFKLQVEHLGRTQINEYTECGDFIRSTLQ